MVLDPIITADDVIRAGACRDGVYFIIDRAHKQGRRLPAVMPVSAVLKMLTPAEQTYVLLAAEMDGSYAGSGYGFCGGCDYGDGFGSGYGDGYGNGHGHGHGSGNAYAYGSGSGDGDSFSSVSGFGLGYGYGYDAEDGDGYGYGSGSSNGDGPSYAYRPGHEDSP